MSTIEQQTPLRQPPEHERRHRVSVVVPCLNEAGTIEECVRRAHQVLDEQQIFGEIIVVDNASEDGSGRLATAAGAKVVYEPQRGYGSSYLAGLAAAGGDYIVMADADLHIVPFAVGPQAGA